MTTKSTSTKRRSASSIAGARLAALDGKTRKNASTIQAQVASGELVEQMIIEMKTYGVNEFGERLDFSEPCFEECLRLVGDLRVARVYVSGCSQRFKSASVIQVNAWMSQRAGLATLFSWPKARMLELLQPRQHLPVLKNWSKVSGITTITREMRTSTTTYDVGVAPATFTHVNSQKSDSEIGAGTSSVAVTASLLTCDESSQSPLSAQQALFRRLDAGKIKTHPVRLTGTPSGGSGIESSIADADYEFIPHVICNHCGKLASLHPFGALFRPEMVRSEDGTLLKSFCYEDGMPRKLFCHDPNNSFETAFVGCEYCEQELSDESRYEARFWCVKNKISLQDFLQNVVPEQWEKKQLRVGLWVGALSRQRTNIAAEIMADCTLENISDFYQQRCGTPSTFAANCITSEALINALERKFFTKDSFYQTHNLTDTPEAARQDRIRSVKLCGIDQGRSSNYFAAIEFIFDSHLPPNLAFSTAKWNILALECFPSFATGELLAKYDIDGGFIDNEPSIASAAKICSETGLTLADQQAKQKDDFIIKQVQDGGEFFDCVKIKHKKFAKHLFALFSGANIAVNRDYLRFAGGKSKESGDIFKHLTRVSWDSDSGDLVRAPDKSDDIFFSAVFCCAAFAMYLVDPSHIALNKADWSWMDSF
jgi:hypothetical protein